MTFPRGRSWKGGGGPKALRSEPRPKFSTVFDDDFNVQKDAADAFCSRDFAYDGQILNVLMVAHLSCLFWPRGPAWASST